MIALDAEKLLKNGHPQPGIYASVSLLSLASSPAPWLSGSPRRRISPLCSNFRGVEYAYVSVRVGYRRKMRSHEMGLRWNGRVNMLPSIDETCF